MPDASGLTLCMTTVARACRPFWTLFSAAGVHRRRRACSRRGPFLHTHTCSSSRSRLQPRSRILHSTSTSSSTAACGPQVRLAAHPPAPLQRPRPPCYRAHHARPPACLLARGPPPRVHHAALTSHVIRLSVSYCRRRATYVQRAWGVGLRGFGGGGGGRPCSQSMSCVGTDVGADVHAHVVPWVIPACVLCVCFSALVVTRVSCTVSLLRAVAYLASTQKKKTPFEPNARSLLFR